ncbi:hypothetical protein GDO81_009407 [Engystomops pustulosus]|uniref:Uncharacterized protein n=1 Tax=Engystomops pustulosus TaxID=76066 RepID=A0AAV7BQT5_ENGPU|nr:hypothetical protein GDO81_009407 [Engystomops pustulosus]
MRRGGRSVLLMYSSDLSGFKCLHHLMENNLLFDFSVFPVSQHLFHSHRRFTSVVVALITSIIPSLYSSFVKTSVDLPVWHKILTS